MARHHNIARAGDAATGQHRQSACDVEVAQNDVIDVVDHQIVCIDADRAHKLVVGRQHHILAGRFYGGSAQHFPAIAIAHALGLTRHRCQSLDEKVVANAGRSHVQAADGSETDIASGIDGEVTSHAVV